MPHGVTMKPGDKVIRIAESKNGAIKGQVYTVVRVELESVYLKELDNGYCYDAKKFKVVRALPSWF